MKYVSLHIVGQKKAGRKKKHCRCYFQLVNLGEADDLTSSMYSSTVDGGQDSDEDGEREREGRQGIAPV